MKQFLGTLWLRLPRSPVGGSRSRNTESVVDPSGRLRLSVLRCRGAGEVGEDTLLRLKSRFGSRRVTPKNNNKKDPKRWTCGSPKNKKKKGNWEPRLVGSDCTLYYVCRKTIVFVVVGAMINRWRCNIRLPGLVTEAKSDPLSPRPLKHDTWSSSVSSYYSSRTQHLRLLSVRSRRGKVDAPKPFREPEIRTTGVNVTLFLLWYGTPILLLTYSITRTSLTIYNSQNETNITNDNKEEILIEGTLP